MSFSIRASLNGCKVDTAYAEKHYSSRYLNPKFMTCPVWGGVDIYGRPVHPDTAMNKTAGCSDPMDRIKVENSQRPKYSEYVGWNIGGIKGDFFEPYESIQGRTYDTQGQDANAMVKNYAKMAGKSGYSMRAVVPPKSTGTCGVVGMSPDCYMSCSGRNYSAPGTIETYEQMPMTQFAKNSSSVQGKMKSYADAVGRINV